MGIYLKYAAILLVWAGLFSLSYFELNSQTEEEVLRLNREMANAQSGKQFSTTQTILLDDIEQLNLQTISQQDPYLTQVISKTKLTDTENFEFVAYFQPEVIYIHSIQSNQWNKADYTHPAAGQLEGLKDPMAFWLSLLKHAAKLEKASTNHSEHYVIQLGPFEEEIHGLSLTDVEKGTFEMWAKSPPFQIEKMKVEIWLKPNIIRGYDRVTYLLNVTDQGNTAGLTLPKEAETAERLR